MVGVPEGEAGEPASPTLFFSPPPVLSPAYARCMDRQPTDYKGHSDISARWNRSRHDQSPPPWSQPNAPSRPQSMSADWASLFSAPLNPSVFAALAASGVFGHLPQGGPFNVPAFPADFHPSTSSSPAPSLSSTPGSWSQPSSSYGASNPSHFPYKTPHPRQSPQLHKDRPSSCKSIPQPRLCRSPCNPNAIPSSWQAPHSSLVSR